MSRIQEAPFVVKMELSEGCNLRCSFCGLNGIRGAIKEDNRYFFMSPETAEAIARDIKTANWTPRIELALRGEPTMNPERNAIIAKLRSILPDVHIMMTSNGGGLLGKPGIKENLLALFDAGLNVLALDDYDGVNIVPKIMEAILNTTAGKDWRQEWVRDAGIATFLYPEQPEGNPYRRHKSSAKIISFLKDIKHTAKDKDGVRDNLSNHCGAAAPVNNRMANKRCARPFRELSIRYDGQIMLCCNSWRGETKIGSIDDYTIKELWQSPVLDAYRQLLYHGQRTIGECKGCDSKSFRTGLLPDPTGKASLPEPTDKTYAIIKQALKGPPMTKPVIRPWEK